MYPKQTSFQTIHAESDREYQRKISRHHDMSHSNLILHKNENSQYQYFEINMPYLILYENVNPAANSSMYMELSESSIVDAHMDYKAFSSMGGLRLHSHDFYELTFVLSGELNMRIEDEYITYRPGECCLCNKNIHHVEVMDHNTEIVLFLLKEEYLRDLINANYYYDKDGNPHAIGSVFQRFFRENKKNSLYDAKVYTDFRLADAAMQDHFFEIINRMVEEISGNHSGKSHMMKALFCRFIEMLEFNDTHKVALHWAKLSGDEQIIYQIANAYQDKMGLFSRAEIETLTGYNSDYVERIMKRSTGKTLSAYGKTFLLKKAADMLTDTDKKVGDICELLGYSNRNYFNKLFFKEYGMTPSEYRKS